MEGTEEIKFVKEKALGFQTWVNFIMDMTAEEWRDGMPDVRTEFLKSYVGRLENDDKMSLGTFLFRDGENPDKVIVIPM